MQTVVHVTHEAIQKVGGIGAVLHGLLTSKTYLARATRNILIGPLFTTDEPAEHRLGEQGEVLYSGIDGLSRTPLGPRLADIERDFDVRIVYGRRRFIEKDTQSVSTPEVLLIDVSRFEPKKIGAFKYELWKRFGLESGRYEHIWDYELYVRLAQPAIAALHALGAAASAASSAATMTAEPCVILAHEYMGMPTALAARMDEQGNFRTIFHAHEVAPVRRIVENHPGHDTMFYNVMRAATKEGRSIDQTFGDQSDYYRHALVKTAQFCDGIFAVGDYTLKEIRFLAPQFSGVDAQVAYNGVPHWQIDLKSKLASRAKLKRYCQTLLRFEPTFVFTHVTRLVPSKALWRDLRVLEHLEAHLRQRNETAVLYTLSTEVPARRPDEIRRMEQSYQWPATHREGAPDLSWGEAIYYRAVQAFNAKSRNIKVVFVNQFGWDQKVCGSRMPADMEFMDIRKGSDVEFGQSIYEPFGIAQVEPISFGGICIYSNVCGCAGFVERAAGGATSNVIVADYTALPDASLPIEQLKQIGQAERDALEHVVAQKVADELIGRLPRKDADFASYLERGHAIAAQMSWDAVAREYIVPGLIRASRAKPRKAIA